MSARVLLIHLDRPGEILPQINLMPIGLVSIAAYLESRGHQVRVVHEGVERRRDPAFSLAEAIATEPCDVVGFALHWHQQATRVIEAARSLRARFPDLMIVLGGFTASRFADEILRDHPEIDYVIRGDAEVPFAALLSSPRTLSAVPNLVYREEGIIKESEVHHFVDEENVRALSFSRFDLVASAGDCLRVRMDTVPLHAEPSFSFSAGRGCEAACLYCGGGRQVQKKYQLRERTVMFPIDFVAGELEAMVARGVHRWSTCFDPLPTSDYYLDLFRELRRRGLKLTAIFDCFRLPARAFVDAFQETFEEGSALNLSPETGSEPLRRRVRTWSYDNAALFEALTLITDKRVLCSVYFSTGFPFETREDFAKTIELVKEIVRRFPNVQVHAGAIDLEPGSPLFDHQARLGIESDVFDFASLLTSQKTPKEIRYRTRVFSSEEILENLARIQAEGRR